MSGSGVAIAARVRSRSGDRLDKNTNSCFTQRVRRGAPSSTSSSVRSGRRWLYDRGAEDSGRRRRYRWPLVHDRAAQAGFDVDVVEKNPAWDVYGVGIIQPGNALRALHELGLAHEAVGEGCRCTATRPGRRMGDASRRSRLAAARRGSAARNGITRPRLHEILQPHTLAVGADVRTGVTFTALDDRGDGVEVDFTDGETRNYDLVVGADGLYSQVRRRCSVPLRANYTGQVCWRYNLPRIEGLNKIWVYIGATGTAGFCPIGDDLMYMLTMDKPPAGSPSTCRGRSRRNLPRAAGAVRRDRRRAP